MRLNYPIVPPAMSVRDVNLLDLARYCFMTHPVPLNRIEIETESLFRTLRDHADTMAADTDAVLVKCEKIGLMRAHEAADRYASAGSR